jgi:hypothetical protein
VRMQLKQVTDRARLPVLAIALAISTSATPADAAISNQDLVELHRAGLSIEAIVRQVDRDGLGRELTVRDFVELSRAGLPAELLERLGNARSSFDVLRQARTLVAAGNYDRAAEMLETERASSGADGRVAAFLAVIRLRQGRTAESRALLASIDQPEVRAELDRLLDLRESATAQVSQIQAAVRSLDREAAMGRAASPAALFEGRESLLRGAVHLLSAEFDPAREASSSLAGTAREAFDGLIERHAAEYERLWRRVGHYYHEDPTQPWWAPGPRMGNPQDAPKIEEEIIPAVQELARLFPLAPLVQDLLFHVHLLAAPYEELEELGDTILTARGEIRLPCYSGDKRFDLVIDRRNGHFYYEAYPHQAPLWKVDERRLEAVPFAGKYQPLSVRFAEIHTFEQSAKGSMIGDQAPASKQYAFRFNGQGGFPRWMFMSWVHSVYGGRVQRQITNKLGRFLVHVIDRPRLVVDLAEEGEAGSGIGAYLLVGALGAAQLAVVPDLAGQQQILSSVQTEMDRVTKLQEYGRSRQPGLISQWDNAVLSFTDAMVFEEITAQAERLVGQLSGG